MPVSILDSQLKQTATEGFDAFLSVFTTAYKEQVGGIPNETSMPLLNGWQHSLLAYHFFREEIMEGGFIQLIQNGYGGYLFNNPFAKALRLMGLTELSKLVYKAKEIYDANRTVLEQEKSEEDFIALYEQFEGFDELEERFFEMEEQCTQQLAQYIDQHLTDFVDTVVETESPQ